MADVSSDQKQTTQQQLQHQPLQLQQQQQQHIQQQQMQQQHQQQQLQQQQHNNTTDVTMSSTQTDNSCSSTGGVITPKKSSSSSDNKIINSEKLQDLVKQIDPNQRLDDNVEDLLQEIAEDFIENVTSFACALAKHRKSDVLETKDIQLHLERNWNIFIPGQRSENEVLSRRRPAPPKEHQKRVELVRKSIANSKK